MRWSCCIQTELRDLKYRPCWAMHTAIARDIFTSDQVSKHKITYIHLTINQVPASIPVTISMKKPLLSILLHSNPEGSISHWESFCLTLHRHLWACSPPKTGITASSGHVYSFFSICFFLVSMTSFVYAIQKLFRRNSLSNKSSTSSKSKAETAIDNKSSSVEPNSSSVRSNKSSDHRFDGGRRFHNREDVAYVLPNDDEGAVLDISWNLIAVHESNLPA